MKWFHYCFSALLCVGLVLGGAFACPPPEPPPKPVTNEEIKALLLETQRNQLQLAAMVLYSEDRLKQKIEQSRPKPLLPEVR